LRVSSRGPRDGFLFLPSLLRSAERFLSRIFQGYAPGSVRASDETIVRPHETEYAARLEVGLRKRHLAPAAVLVSVAALAWGQRPAVDFTRDVQPILARSCVRCHGAATAEAGLRLDTRAGFASGGASGATAVAGDARASLLFQRVVASDPKIRMPWLTDPLTGPEIETLRRWIEAGAVWPEGAVIAPPAVPSTPAPPAPPAAAGSAAVQFNRDVRPILADNCYSCHGPDRNRRQAGLRLDREESAKERLQSGATAIVPGRADQSAVILRVTDADEARRMPHASSGKARLTAAQIGVLRRWIEQGAPWQPHWSYIRPARPPVPAVRRADWPKSLVDAFVLSEIEKQGFAPAREADARTLLRRLSFDLTGLPPSPEEMRAFLADRAPGAYERQVDRLLASPRFGERMAQYWLDLVRYSDSVGYHSDNARPLWRYRDYVIGAFNRNLPFDRFTAEQLAGDLLPSATMEQKIASGYNRLLQTTEEGGAQPKEYRAIYLADRVRNVSTVWLGATLGCAQCHDHKVDPYLARDFYSFEAMFADIAEQPVGRRRPDYLPNDDERRRLDEANTEIERLRKAEQAIAVSADSVDEWAKTLAGRRTVAWTVLEPVEASTAEGTWALIQGNDFSIIATTAAGPKPPRDTYTVTFKTALRDITAFRLEAITFDELPEGGPGRGAHGSFVVSELAIKDGAGRPIALREASTTTPPAEGFSPAAAIDGRTDAGGWALVEADGQPHRLVVETAEPVGTGEETTLTAVIHQNAGQGRTLGRFRLTATAAPRPVRTEVGLDVPRDILAAAALERAQRTPKQQESLDSFYRRVAPELAAARKELRRAEVRRDELLKTIPHSFITTAREPDSVRILARGNWLDDSGEIVQPAVPHFLPSIETGGRRATRLDLARWLTAAGNPLTARVFVNRVWKLFLGQGLCRTLEDLGSQGEWPTHPELLDWLAVEFVESGWDVKHMVRLLVTSAVYRQDSAASRELTERDPYNRLFARQARFRLDGEVVRDGALAISGLLSGKIGGESVFPYQPRGYWAFLNFPPREWEDSTGEDQYRRGIYTWWQRTFPQPSLLAFDAPSHEECVAERTRSNVPQQALVLLNDPTYVEAARVFAERILRSGGGTFAERLRWAYARALARAPRDEEVRILEQLFRKHSAEYRANPEEAAKVIRAGLAAAAKDLNAVELAAWTSVARAILNLPEIITRT
jgi:cytochrome c553